MKNDIDLEITVPCHTAHLRLIGRLCEKIAREIHCSRELRAGLQDQMALVLTEGMVNAIKHGGDSGTGRELRLRVTVTDSILTIRIYDTGAGFDLEAVPLPDFTVNGLEASGRGIYILKSLMDRVTYTRLNGGNVLEMTKKLS